MLGILWDSYGRILVALVCTSHPARSSDKLHQEVTHSDHPKCYANPLTCQFLALEPARLGYKRN